MPGYPKGALLAPLLLSPLFSNIIEFLGTHPRFYEGGKVVQKLGRQLAGLAHFFKLTTGQEGNDF